MTHKKIHNSTSVLAVYLFCTNQSKQEELFKNQYENDHVYNIHWPLATEFNQWQQTSINWKLPLLHYVIKLGFITN